MGGTDGRGTGGVSGAAAAGRPGGGPGTAEAGSSGLAGLAGVPGRSAATGGGGTESGDLRHSRGPWLRAADGADQLVTHLGPVKGELERAHRGLTAGAGALTALAELGAVRESWERRFEAARGECGSLAGKLRAVVRGQAQVDEAVRSGFDGVRTPTGGGGE